MNPHKTPEPDIARWVIPALIACASLFGLGTLAAVFVYLFEPPEWVTIAMGVGLAVGTAGFAWLVASALGSGRAKEGAQSRSGDESRGQVRRLPDRG